MQPLLHLMILRPFVVYSRLWSSITATGRSMSAHERRQGKTPRKWLEVRVLPDVLVFRGSRRPRAGRRSLPPTPDVHMDRCVDFLSLLIFPAVSPPPVLTYSSVLSSLWDSSLLLSHRIQDRVFCLQQHLCHLCCPSILLPALRVCDPLSGCLAQGLTGPAGASRDHHSLALCLLVSQVRLS